MAVTVTEKTSWFTRIKNSIGGIVFGIILFLGAFPLLFWNEGRAVQRYKTLKEGAGEVVTVSSEQVDSANEGKLIHMSGKADTTEVLRDATFNVEETAIKLKRTVEMYQWIEDSESETTEKLGGGTETTTTYTYHKDWSTSVIDSSGFQEYGHDNPGTMPYESESWVADNVTLGAFTLSDSLVGSINNYTDYTVPASSEDGMTDYDFYVTNGHYYSGYSETSPEIGDVRVTFEVVKPSVISIVAKQVGTSFEAYEADAGGTIELLQLGEVSAEEMFEDAITGNTIVTWLIRVGGFFMMFLGLSMIFKPLSVVADVVPFIGNIVEKVTGFVAGAIAFGFSLVTIAIAWVFYRPLIGIGLIAIAAVGVFFGVKLAKKK